MNVMKFLRIGSIHLIVCMLLISTLSMAITQMRVSQINQFIADLNNKKLNNISQIQQRQSELKQGLSSRELQSAQLKNMDKAVNARITALQQQAPQTGSEIKGDLNAFAQSIKDAVAELRGVLKNSSSIPLYQFENYQLWPNQMEDGLRTFSSQKNTSVYKQAQSDINTIKSLLPQLQKKVKQTEQEPFGSKGKEPIKPKTSAEKQAVQVLEKATKQKIEGKPFDQVAAIIENAEIPADQSAAVAGACIVLELDCPSIPAPAVPKQALIQEIDKFESGWIKFEGDIASGKIPVATLKRLWDKPYNQTLASLKNKVSNYTDLKNRTEDLQTRLNNALITIDNREKAATEKPTEQSTFPQPDVLMSKYNKIQDSVKSFERSVAQAIPNDIKMLQNAYQGYKKDLAELNKQTLPGSLLSAKIFDLEKRLDKAFEQLNQSDPNIKEFTRLQKLISEYEGFIRTASIDDVDNLHKTFRAYNTQVNTLHSKTKIGSSLRTDVEDLSARLNDAAKNIDTIIKTSQEFQALNTAILKFEQTTATATIADINRLNDDAKRYVSQLDTLYSKVPKDLQQSLKILGTHLENALLNIEKLKSIRQTMPQQSPSLDDEINKFYQTVTEKGYLETLDDSQLNQLGKKAKDLEERVNKSNKTPAQKSALKEKKIYPAQVAIVAAKQSLSVKNQMNKDKEEVDNLEDTIMKFTEEVTLTKPTEMRDKQKGFMTTYTNLIGEVRKRLRLPDETLKKRVSDLEKHLENNVLKLIRVKGG